MSDIDCGWERAEAGESVKRSYVVLFFLLTFLGGGLLLLLTPFVSALQCRLIITMVPSDGLDHVVGRECERCPMHTNRPVSINSLCFLLK